MGRAGVSSAVVLVINWIYFSRTGGSRPSTWRPACCSWWSSRSSWSCSRGYIAFTNYGDGHNGSRIRRSPLIELTAQQARRGLAGLPRHRRRQGQFLFLLVTDPDGEARLGNTETALEEISDAGMDSDRQGQRRATAGRTLNFAGRSSRTSRRITGPHGPGLRRPERRGAAHPGRLEAYQFTSSPRVRRGRRHMTTRHRNRLRRHRHAAPSPPRRREPAARLADRRRVQQLRRGLHRPQPRAGRSSTSRSGPSRSRSSRWRSPSSSGSSSRSSSTTRA